MPFQIKALFDANPQMGIELMDYDYVGEAKEEDYSSFANTLYDIMEIVAIVFWLCVPLLWKIVDW